LIGPTPSPNVVRACPGFSVPACASANAVPIVGCPANGVSAVRVKMRTRWSVPAASGGNTNVHSDRFDSRVIVCIVSVSSPAGWVNTNS